MFARKIATQTSRKATNSSTPSDTRSAAIVRACPLDKASKVARQTSVSRQHNSYTKYVPLQPATGQVHLHSVHACKTKENPWHPPCGRWSQHVKYESTQQLTFFQLNIWKPLPNLLRFHCQGTMKQSPQSPLLVATSPALLSYARRRGARIVLLSSKPGNACCHSSP